MFYLKLSLLFVIFLYSIDRPILCQDTVIPDVNTEPTVTPNVSGVSSFPVSTVNTTSAITTSANTTTYTSQQNGQESTVTQSSPPVSNPQHNNVTFVPKAPVMAVQFLPQKFTRFVPPPPPLSRPFAPQIFPASYSFNPQMIRRQGPNYIALPVRNQPVFDPAVHCKNQETVDHSLKREVEKRSLQFKRLESFFMNPKNHDVLFSICGNIIPSHMILIESISPQFEEQINGMKKSDSPISINALERLIGNRSNSSGENENGDGSTDSTIDTPVTDPDQCPDVILFEAFKQFIKYFYTGNSALEEIDNLNVSFAVWKLSNKFLNPDIVKQVIEPKIGKLIDSNNFSQIYRFAKANQIEYLIKVWTEFVANQLHKPNGDQFQSLKLSCDDIQEDTDYLDRFLEALNANQTYVIAQIKHYMESCTELTKLNDTSVNMFPRSLIFFRCTIDDLKQLVAMGFINHEILAEELENRLRAKERSCEEKCPPQSSHNSSNVRQQMAYTAPNKFPYNRRA